MILFRKKISVGGLLLVVISLILMGCSGGNKTETESGEKSGNKSLVVYSNSVSDGRGEWLKEHAEKSGFKIDFVDIGGSDLANRIISEKNNPVADVIFGLNSMGFESLKANETLDKYVPVWADEIEEGMNDKEGYAHALVRQAIILIYDTEDYDEQSGPQDWPDLWEKAEFKNKYFVNQGLEGGTIRVAIAGILTRYQDPNGELGISQEGWKALEKFYSQGYVAPSEEDLFASLAEDKTSIGIMWSSGLEQREKDFNIKAGVVSPKIGVPYVVEQIALVKGSKNQDQAKEFIDWFGSAEVQGEWAQEFSQLPANKNAQDQAPEYVKKLVENLKSQDIDWKFVSENMDQWVEKIELELIP